MNLPMSGRVVIVDDEFQEALPLIRTLSQRRVAVTFFRGRLEDLPSEPFKDVRIVFLDIVLEGLEGADDKTKISTLMNVVKRIISKENGPFILAIWTKHPELTEKLQNALKKEGFYTLTVNLEKDTFFEKKEGSDEWAFKEDKKDKLQRIIKEKIRAIDIFKVFINWENLIHDASSMTINEISKFSEFDDHWNDKMKRIFFSFAKAQTGRLIENMEDREKITSALYTFNQIFSDIFERDIQQFIIEGISLEDGDIGEEVKVKINSRILIDTAPRNELYPGNVYKDQNAEVTFIKEILNENREDVLGSIAENSISIFVEVTPICDFVQRKAKMNRVIKGVLIPDSAGTNTGIWRRIKKHTSFLYVSPTIHYEGKDYRMILDFRYFTSLKGDEIKNRKLLFRIRKELLSDIQIKLSSHINRTGVLYIE